MISLIRLLQLEMPLGLPPAQGLEVSDQKFAELVLDFARNELVVCCGLGEGGSEGREVVGRGLGGRRVGAGSDRREKEVTEVFGECDTERCGESERFFIGGELGGSDKEGDRVGRRKRGQRPAG